jgi:hypothetical protein
VALLEESEVPETDKKGFVINMNEEKTLSTRKLHNLERISNKNYLQAKFAQKNESYPMDNVTSRSQK